MKDDIEEKQIVVEVEKNPSQYKQINFIFMLTVLFYIASSIIIQGLWENNAENAVYHILLGQFIIVLPAIFYYIKNKKNFVKSIRLKRLKVSTILLIIVFAYVIQPLLAFLNAFSMLFTKNEIVDTITQVTSNHSLLLIMITLALVPCLVEEFLFRGVFYSEFRKVSIWKGMLLSALFFGFMHMNANQFAYTLVMGIIFTIVIEATGSLLSSVIIHFTLNANTALLVYLLPRIQEMLRRYAGQEMTSLTNDLSTKPSQNMLVIAVLFYGLLSIVAIVLGALLIVQIAKMEGRWPAFLNYIKNREYRKKSERMITMPAIIGMLCCMGMVLLKHFQN